MFILSTFQREEFQLYATYCKNKPKSEALRRELHQTTFLTVSKKLSWGSTFFLVNKRGDKKGSLQWERICLKSARKSKSLRSLYCRLEQVFRHWIWTLLCLNLLSGSLKARRKVEKNLKQVQIASSGKHKIGLPQIRLEEYIAEIPR